MANEVVVNNVVTSVIYQDSSSPIFNKVKANNMFTSVIYQDLSQIVGNVTVGEEHVSVIYRYTAQKSKTSGSVI